MSITIITKSLLPVRRDGQTTTNTGNTSSGTYVPSGVHEQAWSTITDTPTTLGGYGITDAAPLANPMLTGYAQISANNPDLRIKTNSAGTISSPVSRKVKWLNYADEEAGSINLLDYNQDTSATNMDFSVRNGSGVVSKVMRLSSSGADVTGEVKGTSLKIGDFTLEVVSGELVVKNLTTIIATISSAGYIKAKNELEPFADI